jgi:hypothetical protein
VAHSVQHFSPALLIDEFFESFFDLAKDGKLSDKEIAIFTITVNGVKT